MTGHGKGITTPAQLFAIADRMKEWRESPSVAFDKVADEFYRERHMMAPGKSVPLEMAIYPHDDETRRRQFEAWTRNQQINRESVLRSAAIDLEGYAAALLMISLKPCQDLPRKVDDECDCSSCIARRAICPF